MQVARLKLARFACLQSSPYWQAQPRGI